ncbi:flagellar basal body P-ring biosynthesis protein A [Fulvimarina pelagi HTCC2506]|uniref:Flagella basal body P-ring formation protein FlgA n=1 Tax=Fulvimarina pelagi HTCC2506 TaxID=314231 RepID=Q0G0Z5_9HYPH|nr:flagellar basal body P-ring formation chaperone FlgA [Fulvimarina pelagi]EAU40844.1 flagellar basal body P-ring biosynthesis protein A [Fulvimarina pelagi HTCC2506]
MAGRLLKTALALSLGLSGATGSLAAELDMPVPGVVIYPGQDIVAAGLSTRTFIVKDEKVGLFVVDREDLYGHVARRTLLPGKAIRRADLTTPDAVKAGTNVTLIYAEEGLVITGLGMALESGQEGETIRVRNTDSGITISGRISPDGTIAVEG